ncbi:MAG: putative toxin-antitoxin system toxin component, PIN family [Alphaproteobacteria bacterium]|nr:putative toxin-antitoxin system toxin component, PIN family [Alphaproteobacteria bacterium]
MRYVLDTNILVAGLRSPAGASAALLEQALAGAFAPLLSVPLVLEYEATCCHPEHLAAAGLDEAEVRAVIDALCDVAETVTPHFLWRPVLRDAADEMVLEAAINGRADALVTFNRRHFAGADRFGIDLLGPANALRRLET